MPLDVDKLIGAIDAKWEASLGNNNSQLVQQRVKNIEYYLGYNTNPAPEGRSQVVDRSVYETVSAMLPSLTRIYAFSSDNIVKCVPQGPEDEQAASQETSVLNYVVTQQNPWEQIFGDWCHDSLISGNGYCVAVWDDSKTVERETYEGQSDDQLTMLLNDTNVKVIQHSEYVDEQSTKDAQAQYEQQMQQYQMLMMSPQAQQAMQMGQPMPPQPQMPGPVMLHDLVIERTNNEGKVRLFVVPPENCYVDDDTPDYSLQNCNYFEYREERSLSDLRASGFDIPDDIADDDDVDDLTQESAARNRYGENAFEDDDERDAARMITCRYIWIRADVEDDDVARLYQVLRIGNRIIYSEPCSRIHVASMTPQPLPHRHLGLSVAETITDFQDIRTSLKRGGLDNLYLQNNGRYIISSRVNLDDFLDSRPGGVVRMLDDSLPGEGHVFPLTHPSSFAQVIQGLEYFDEERQNRSGVTRYFSGTDAGAINKTASGIAQLSNAASQRVEHIARNFGPAVEYLFSCVQELMSKHHNKALTIQVKGQWVAVDPQAWRTKRDMRISVGVGAGNKDGMMHALGNIYNTQLQQLQAGSGVVTPENIFNTLNELAKLAGFPNPDKFYTDPKRNPPQPPNPPPQMIIEKAKLQQADEHKQLDLQAGQQKSQADMQFNQWKVIQDNAAAERIAQIDAQKELAIEQIRLGGSNGPQSANLPDPQMEAQREAQEEAMNQQILQLVAALGQSQQAQADNMQALAEAFMQASQAMVKAATMMGAPKEVVRDPAGRVVGVRTARVH